MKEKDKKTISEEEKLEKRRKALKNILAGSGSVVTAAALNEKWAKPVIESVVLPSHAQTSVVSFATGGLSLVRGIDQNELLNLLVPSAHADYGTTLPPTKTVEICIKPLGLVGGVQKYAVEVTASGDSNLYTATVSIPFSDTQLSPSGPGVFVSGELNAAGNQVFGVINYGATSTKYGADAQGIVCSLVPIGPA